MAQDCRKICMVIRLKFHIYIYRSGIFIKFYRSDFKNVSKINSKKILNGGNFSKMFKPEVGTANYWFKFHKFWPIFGI